MNTMTDSNDATETSTKTWSDYQKAVFANVATGTGHTVVMARAGSGKTTTIIEAAKSVPAGLDVLLVAFNKNIARELADRAPGNVEVATLHSYGFRCVRRAFPKVRLDADARTDGVARRLLGDGVKYVLTPMRRAVSLAKNLLLSTPAEIDQAIDAYGVDLPDTLHRDTFVANVAAVVAESKKGSPDGTIDFDDMIWLPVVLKLRQPKYSRVFIDETQDLNPAQLALALGAVTEDGRILAVGDDRQAIYGFRGAGGAASMDRIITGMGAAVLPLSVTYRCPRSVVRVAQEVVPSLEAAPHAVEGEVVECAWSKVRDDVKPGDFVLSRVNAPLVKEMIKFVRDGRRACMLGRDIGASLAGMLRRSKADTVRGFFAWLAVWEKEEIARLEAKDADTETVLDKVATLRILCDGLSTVAEVETRIESFFADAPGHGVVTFATTHKAKGLEAERVFLFADAYRVLRKGQSEVSVEESNLWYVAVTRARTSLFLTYGAAEKKEN